MPQNRQRPTILILSGIAFAAAIASYSFSVEASNLKQRTPQQQNFNEKLKAPKPALREQPDASEQEKDAARHEEAQLIYTHFRTQQNMSHEEAVAALERSGFPIGEIKEK